MSTRTPLENDVENIITEAVDDAFDKIYTKFVGRDGVDEEVISAVLKVFFINDFVDWWTVWLEDA